MEWDLIVIGGGSGGLTASRVAARMGARVLLVEKRALGGDCLFTGCVPSKTLIRSANVAHLIRQGARHGVPSVAPTVDGARVMSHVQEVIARVAKHDSVEQLTGLGVEVRIGEARFDDPAAIEVAGERLTARAFILSTGSHPQVPPIAGLEESGYLTSDTLFSLRALPASLVVMGGGVERPRAGAGALAPRREGHHRRGARSADRQGGCRLLRRAAAASGERGAHRPHLAARAARVARAGGQGPRLHPRWGGGAGGGR